MLNLTKKYIVEIKRNLFAKEYITENQVKEIEKKLDKVLKEDNYDVEENNKFLNNTILITSDSVKAKLEKDKNVSSSYFGAAYNNYEKKYDNEYLVFTTANNADESSFKSDEIYIIFKSIIEPSLSYDAIICENFLIIYHPAFKFGPMNIYYKTF